MRIDLSAKSLRQQKQRVDKNNKKRLGGEGRK
jgi:hypothetical protein